MDKDQNITDHVTKAVGTIDISELRKDYIAPSHAIRDRIDDILYKFENLLLQVDSMDKANNDKFSKIKNNLETRNKLEYMYTLSTRLYQGANILAMTKKYNKTEYYQREFIYNFLKLGKMIISTTMSNNGDNYETCPADTIILNYEENNPELFVFNIVVPTLYNFTNIKLRRRPRTDWKSMVVYIYRIIQMQKEMFEYLNQIDMVNADCNDAIIEIKYTTLNLLYHLCIEEFIKLERNNLLLSIIQLEY